MAASSEDADAPRFSGRGAPGAGRPLPRGASAGRPRGRRGRRRRRCAGGNANEPPHARAPPLPPGAATGAATNGALVPHASAPAAGAAAAPPPAGPRRFVRQQVPDSVLHDAALNAALSALPPNYNFEVHKTVWRLRQARAARVALQFPEGLLMYACTLADILQDHAGALGGRGARAGAAVARSACLRAAAVRARPGRPRPGASRPPASQRPQPAPHLPPPPPPPQAWTTCL